MAPLDLSISTRDSALAPRLRLADGQLLSIYDLGLACCAVEFISAALGDHGLDRSRLDPLASDPSSAHVLVVSGTCTDVLAPMVRQAYDSMPEPRVVISFGACANSGGPYWDSYVVTNGIDHIVPVDLYVPGCPPRPEALVSALEQLLGSAEA